MLPDFASMASVRLGVPGSREVQAGVSFHHRTDAVFHAAAPFLALMKHTVEQLTAEGAARGPARAIGHVGVEMLIDGELLTRSGTPEAFERALRQARSLDDDPALSPVTREGLQWVRGRLTAHGVPHDYRNTDAVVVRLSRMLSGRPRLALDPGTQHLTRALLPSIQEAVASRIDEILDAVRTGLGQDPGPHG
jgi:hypothetical protein